MSWLKRLSAAAIVIVVVAYGVLFSIQNNEIITVNFVVLPPLEGSAAFWVLLAFCVGGGLGLLFSSAVLVASKAQLSAAKRKLLNLEQELSKSRLSASK